MSQVVKREAEVSLEPAGSPLPLAQIHLHSTDEGKRQESVSLFAACHPEVLMRLIMLLASPACTGPDAPIGLLGGTMQRVPQRSPGPSLLSRSPTRQPGLQHHLLHVLSAPEPTRQPSWVLGSSRYMHLTNGGCAATHCPLAVSCLSPGYVSSCPRRHTERISVFPV